LISKSSAGLRKLRGSFCFILPDTSMRTRTSAGFSTDWDCEAYDHPGKTEITRRQKRQVVDRSLNSLLDFMNCLVDKIWLVMQKALPVEGIVYRYFCS